MNFQRDFAPFRGKLVERRQRYSYFIAYALDIQQKGIGLFVKELSSQLSDHRIYLIAMVGVRAAAIEWLPTLR
jgi:hypothetical protein